MICPELPSEDNPGSMAPGARQIYSIRDAGIEVQIVDMRGIPKLKYVQVIPKVRRAIRQVDLVHAHFGYCGWLALLGRRLAMRRVPIVMSYMGDDLLGTPSDEKGTLETSSIWAAKVNIRWAKRYDQVIVKSREMAEKLSPVVCHVIPNGIDLNVFHPESRDVARQRLGWSLEGQKVLFPGDPKNPRKGFQLAQAAVERAGQNLGRSLELVPLWGVKPDMVPAYMNACNAMLMTSLIEGSPNVVKEALACNANVIAVPVGDAHEMLEGVQNCQRVSRQPEQIAAALCDVLQNNELSNGRLRLQERRLSLDGVAQQVLEVYRQALAPLVERKSNLPTASRK
jgi:glycosyltransferase involved in cell wall biosynthesis